jgi:ribonuclease BN (tRNA processing enzyme)
MRLTVVGAGPAYTDRPDASGAAYLVADGDTTVLLDLGHGSFARLFAYVHPTRIDAIVISHLHPDHFIDLVPLRHYLRYEFHPPRRARVLGPRDLAARIDALHAEPGFTAEALDTEPLGERTWRIGSLTLESRLVAHTDESYAFRVSAATGPGLVYSGDCGRADDLLPLLHPGDTLLAEIAFGTGPVPPGVLHLDGSAVGRVAAAGGASRILLTHVLGGVDLETALAAVAAESAAPARFVWPGDQLEI